MKEQSRRACGAERGGDFLGDDSAFAHAGDHDAAVAFAAAEDEIDGAGEGLGHGAFEAQGEGFEGGGLGADQIRRR
jgi:hypothetical protein